ncbi:MAG: alpha/beta hydrolase [Lachnospiraceae bacterium]|nr:alpha/beta hydrolase [Lachnospiraceae bacterium]
MSIKIRQAKSKEIKKNIKVVKLMTRGMSFDENMSKVNWKAVRRISNIGYAFMPKEKGIKVYRINIGDTVSEISIPDISKANERDDEVIILYIHGGGFVSGSASSSRGYSSMLAKYLGYKVIAVNYRLAPEHPFPAGLDDCYNVVSDVLRRYPKSKLILVGESAGANLAIATALRAKDNGINRIVALIIHSPFMDFSASLNRDEHKVDDFTVKEGCLKSLNEIYVGDNDVKNPYISPIYGDYNGFPPTFITCDYNETLYADAVSLYRLCEEAGVNVEMIQMKGAFHAFATTGTGTPETKQILEECVEFMRENVLCFTMRN